MLGDHRVKGINNTVPRLNGIVRGTRPLVPGRFPRNTAKGTIFPTICCRLSAFCIRARSAVPAQLGSCTTAARSSRPSGLPELCRTAAHRTASANNVAADALPFLPSRAVPFASNGSVAALCLAHSLRARKFRDLSPSVFSMTSSMAE